jgi:hypothetical protein
MSKNYPGSLYSINHGDGSPTKYYNFRKWILWHIWG